MFSARYGGGGRAKRHHSGAIGKVLGKGNGQHFFLTPPFTRFPPRGKPGRIGSPHAAYTAPLLPQEGFQNASLKSCASPWPRAAPSARVYNIKPGALLR